MQINVLINQSLVQAFSVPGFVGEISSIKRGTPIKTIRIQSASNLKPFEYQIELMGLPVIRNTVSEDVGYFQTSLLSDLLWTVGELQKNRRDMFLRKASIEKISQQSLLIKGRHCSVVLVYDKEEHIAPEVSVKGAGFLHHAIKEFSKMASIFTCVDDGLATRIHQRVKIEGCIPHNCYTPVAKVFARSYAA